MLQTLLVRGGVSAQYAIQLQEDDEEEDDDDDLAEEDDDEAGWSSMRFDSEPCPPPTPP